MKAIVFGLCLLVSSQLFADHHYRKIVNDQNREWDEMFFGIDQVEMTVTEESGPLSAFTTNLSVQNCSGRKVIDVGSGEVLPDVVVNIGRKVWELVKDNEEKTYIDTPSAQAMPLGIFCWDQLENWLPVKSRHYEFVMKNFVGLVVAEFDLRVVYVFGGSLKGKGKYLANLAVLPGKPDVMWGFTLNSNAFVNSVGNIGTTHQPLAQVEVKIHWIVDNIVNHAQQLIGLRVDGNGNFQEADTGQIMGLGPYYVRN